MNIKTRKVWKNTGNGMKIAIDIKVGTLIVCDYIYL